MKTRQVTRVAVVMLLLAGLGLSYAYFVTTRGPTLQPEQYYAALAATAKDEVVTERDKYSKVFQVNPTTRMLRISAQPIHYRDNQGQWQEIALDIVPSRRAGFDLEMTRNAFQAFFQENSTSAYLVRYEARGAGVEFGVEAEQPWGRLQPVQAQARGNQIIYHDLFPGVDLRYELSPQRMLEEFIVKQPELVQPMVAIHKRFRAEGVSWRLEADGSIAFVRSGSGERLWHIPRPVVYELGDPAHQSYGVHFEIEEGDGYFALRKVLDSAGQAWLSDPSRKFPVVMDDTVDLDENDLSSQFGDGYVSRITTRPDCSLSTNDTYARDTGQPANTIGCYPPTGNKSIYRGAFEWNTTDAQGKTIQALGVFLNGTQAYNNDVGFVKLPQAPSQYPNNNNGNKNLYNAIGSGSAYITATKVIAGFNYITLSYRPVSGTSCSGCDQAIQDLEAHLTDATPLFYFGVRGRVENDPSVNGYGTYTAKEDTTNVDNRPDLVLFYQGIFGDNTNPERPLRNVIWDGTNYWLVYTDNTGVQYGYSSDGGSTWTRVDTLDPNADSRHHTVWYNAAINRLYAAYHVHPTGYATGVGDMLAKVGDITSSPPSITWLTPTGNNIAFNASETNNEGYDYPGITRDNAGYCWVLARWAVAVATLNCPVNGTPGYCYAPTLTRSNNTDCTDWPGPSSYYTLTNVIHTTLSPGDVRQPGGYVIPLVTNNRVYIVWKDFTSSGSNPLYGRQCSWSGSAITCQGTETIDATTETGVYVWGMSAVAIGDVVHVVYIDADNSLQYTNRDSSGTWATSTALETGVDVYGPGLTLDAGTQNDLYVFYRTQMSLPTPTATPPSHSGNACVYYKKGTSSGTSYTWGSRTQAACNLWGPMDTSTGDYSLLSIYSSKGYSSTTRKIIGLWIEGIYGLDSYSITP